MHVEAILLNTYVNYVFKISSSHFDMVLLYETQINHL